MHQKNNTIDFTHNVSGKADVPGNEDNHGKASGSHFIAISGTINPSGTSYQVLSGGIITPNVPNTQITSVVNTLYINPSNQNLAPFQSSGNSAPTANVPRSESSCNH